MATIFQKRNRLKRQKFFLKLAILINIIAIYLSLYFGIKLKFIFYFFSLPCIYVIYRLQNKIKRLNSGIKGEHTTLYVLKKLRKDYTVLFDLKVKFTNTSSQIDTIVIGKNGVFIIETKNVSGFISGNKHDDNILVSNKYYTDTKSNFKIYNPCKQIATHINRINKTLKKLHINCKVQGIIYFTNPNASVVLKDPSIKIFCHKTNGGYDMLNYIYNSKTEHNLSFRQQEKLIKHLKKYL